MRGEGWAVVSETEIERQLRDIKHHLERLQATTEILLAVRIISDGYATTMRSAIAMARNPYILNTLYPEPV